MKNRIIIGAILTAVFLCYSCSSNQQSEDLKTRLANCASIEDDQERLKCYDQLVQDLGLLTLTGTKPAVDKESPPTIDDENKPIVDKGKWSVDTETNPIDDSKTVTVSLLADEGEGIYGDKIILMIRCKSNKTDLFIGWSSYLGDEANVLTRIGTEDSSRQRWSLSTNSQATFYPGSDITFIKKIMSVDKFVAQVTPYSESPITAVFDVRGLKEAIKPLQEVCGWE